MIQRIQTIYLLLAILLLVSLFYFPVYHLSSINGETLVSINLINSTGPNEELNAEEWQALEAASQGGLLMGGIIINSLIILLAGIAIFLYGNRPLQARIASIAVLLCILLSILLFLTEYKASSELDPDNHIAEYGFGIWIPLLTIILLALSVRAIRKDEALVRSADRLR